MSSETALEQAVALHQAEPPRQTEQSQPQEAPDAMVDASTTGDAPTDGQKSHLIALFNSGSFAELEGHACLLIKQYPASSFAWSVLGGALHMQGKDALPALQKTAELASGDAAAHNNLGNALKERGRADEAVASYRRALEIQPDLAQAHSNLGNVLRELGQFEEAAASCQRALECKPDFADAHFNLANALHGLGRLDDAVASYRRTLDLNPASALAHFYLANVLVELGEMDSAISSYRRALEIEPGYVEAHCNLGNALRDLDRLEDAAQSYRQALQIQRDLVEAHTNLGAILRIVGQLDEAAASYRRVLEINPEDAEGHRGLGLVLYDLRQLDAAVASYRRALEIKPDYADVNRLLAGALWAQKKLDEALACFQQQLRITPEDQISQHLAASLSQQNTEHAPRQYVEAVFDGYANTFDSHLQDKLKYDIPAKLAAFVGHHMGPSAQQWDILDLGCGTGLSGLAFKPFSRRMVGVDISSKMLEKARGRNIYARLEHADLLTMMQAGGPSAYDAVISTDVFIYVGRLDEVMREIKRLLRPNGIVAFSIEVNDALSIGDSGPDTRPGYQLQTTGRYSHTPDYINKLALDNEFKDIEMAQVQIRMEGAKPIAGKLVLLKS